jgi:hypothetical protein
MNRIVLCFVFLAVAAMIFAGCQGAKPDLAAMGKAMSEAKSYRMTTVAGGSETTMEIECPNKVHTITKAGGMTTEMFVIDTASYIKAGGKWMQTTGAAPTVCAKAESFGDTTSGAASPEITKGESTTINGVACQQWSLGAAAASTTYCIAADNYPVQIKTGAATVTYSDWNKVQVQAPQI